ncbi:Mucin-associated surface protein (MASP) subgroup S020 [Trypanosoma cruzi]|uniref:Mucin-associated surface protein (MASP) subgroup S020 n=1 Tax=Trypanosoma cruzi TaxID=5693 RepID=A0A7J6YE12_TRYCR|nr:Mucin-associated surface protein (MASP) subgroup S020 [Trypanosoma cruzi]
MCTGATWVQVFVFLIFYFIAACFFLFVCLVLPCFSLCTFVVVGLLQVAVRFLHFHWFNISHETRAAAGGGVFLLWCDVSLLLLSLCVDVLLVCAEGCTQVTGVMAMMMTGRVLLVCALCVLWCGAGCGAAEEPGGAAEPDVVPLGSTQQQITGGSQREDKGAKEEQGQGRDTNNGDEQPIKKKEEVDEQQSQEQIQTQQDAQALKGNATPQPAGKSSEEGEIDDDSDVQNEIKVLGDGKRNEERVQSQEEVARDEDASTVNLNDSQQETSGGIRTGDLRGKSQKEGEKEGDDGGKKEREKHQEENKRKPQEQNEMLQQKQQQKQQQDQGREHSEYNQKESTKDKNGVGTNQTAITHNSDSSTAATAALRSDAGKEDTPTTNHPNRPSTEGATPPEKTSDGEAASANKYDTVPQSAGSTTAPTTNAKVGDTAKPVDNDGSSAFSHTTSPLLLLLFVVVCAAAAAVVAA